MTKNFSMRTVLFSKQTIISIILVCIEISRYISLHFFNVARHVTLVPQKQEWEL